MKDYELLDENGRATILSNFLGAHRGYRRDAARFPIGVRRLAERGMPADGLEALRAHWNGYKDALLGHHQMEDNLLFPLYRDREPRLGAVLDELETQHHSLDEALDEIDGWLAKLPDLDGIDPLVAAFEALDALVTRHLDLEEDELVPVMQADPPPPPPADGDGGPPGSDVELDFGFVAAWLADGLEEDVVQVLLEASPPPFRNGFDEARRRYTDQLRRWLD